MPAPQRLCRLPGSGGRQVGEGPLGGDCSPKAIWLQLHGRTSEMCRAGERILSSCVKAARCWGNLLHSHNELEHTQTSHHREHIAWYLLSCYAPSEHARLFSILCWLEQNLLRVQTFRFLITTKGKLQNSMDSSFVLPIHTFIHSRNIC